MTRLDAMVVVLIMLFSVVIDAMPLWGLGAATLALGIYAVVRISLRSTR